ncbi:MAG: hypothetical protein LUQ71_04110 [Methanoregula sp.]|nr:hypothetical protein [Methanoregula sp.]
MGRDDEFNEPYLPARYKQKVREKQQRRRVKKILTAAVIIAVIVIIIYIFAGILGIDLQGSPVTRTGPIDTITPTIAPVPVTSALPPDVTTTPPVPDTTQFPPVEYTIVPGVPITAVAGSLSLNDAVTALRDYYPAEDYTILIVNYSAGSTRNLFGFTITPVSITAGTRESVVFIDAATGTPYAAGQETAAVTADKAKGIATGAFPDISANNVRFWYYDSCEKGRVWMFILASGNMTLVSGSVDATSGELVAFTRNIPQSGRQAEPVITRDKAQSIASHYINDKNGGTLPLNQTAARYEVWGTPSVPAAGQYVFAWERQYLDYPVDTDGIIVVVDSVTGDVIGYEKTWTTTDFAFSQTLEQAVAQREAIFAVMQEAKKRFPDSVESIRVLSAEMRWNNLHDPGSSQRPGSIPLEWKVVFDDDTIRSNSSLPPGVGWVDIQTGNVTGIEYRH